MLKGVLFDLGGTLQEYKSEDWPAIDAGLNRDLYEYISSRGHAHRLPPLDEWLEFMNRSTRAHWEESNRTQRGKPLLELLRPLFEQHGITDLQPEECLPTWFKGVTDIAYVEPYVKPTLEMLRAGGLKLGLVSNTAWPSGAHDPDLERFGLKNLLDCRIYSCEVGWEKPAPQIFEAALLCMGLEPHEVVFVGDFLRYDVAGARAVGMKGVWKQIASRPSEVDDHTVVPHATITRIDELASVLADLYGWRPIYS